MRPASSGALFGGLARHECGRLAVLAILLVIRVMVALAVPATLAAVLAIIGAGAPAGPLIWAVAGLFLVGAGADLGIGLVAGSASTRAAVWLQASVVRALLRQAGGGLSAGESTARLAQGVTAAAGLPVTLAMAGAGLLTSVGGLIALYCVDWPAGLTFTIAVPLVLLVARRLVSTATGAQADYLGVQATIAARLVDAVRGARTIQAAGSQAIEVDRVLEPLPALAAAGRATWRVQRAGVWRLGLLLPLVEVAVLAVAGLGVASGRIGPTELVAVIGYLILAASAMSQLDLIFQVAHVRAASDPLAGILAQPSTVGGHAAVPAGPGEVTLRGVTVAHGSDVVLDCLDLTIPGGALVALVGRTGAGKSVTAQLVGRLVEPDRGVVSIDGVPVTDLSLSQLRRAVSYAFERPELVGSTVAEAIRYGRPDIELHAVVAAARMARADAFIQRLPAGYDTPLVDAPMSGGERQRLGLARALARPSSVYVLDDATSGLDTVTEGEITAALTDQFAGRTRLVVAHRVSTAARCDLVAWLDHGRIRALGRHDELWSDPDYRTIFATTTDQLAASHA